MWRRLQNANPKVLAAAAIGLAIVLFACVNIIASTFTAARVDLTQDRIYTLSPATRSVLDDIQEPITIRFFLSTALIDEAPALRIYAARVRELLSAYERLSGGLVRIEQVDPVPFSAEEDTAIGYNLVGFNLSRAGEQGYIGLVGTNSVDQLEVIRVLSPDREPYLEYDLTRMVSRLSKPSEPKIGVLDGLDLFGSMELRRPPAAIMDQLSEDYELVQIAPDAVSMPEDIGALLIIHPHNLTDSALYAIDQYVIRGGPALVFLDALAEHSPPDPVRLAMPQYPDSNLEPLMAAWGVTMVPDRVVGDIDMAMRVRAQAGNQAVLADYPPWLIVDRDNLNSEDVVTGRLELMRISSAGALQPLPDATTTFTPLIETTENSMLYEQGAILRRSDPAELLDMFEPSGTAQVLAARITGPVKTAFPDGPPPAPAPAAGEEPTVPPELVAESDGPISVVVVADTDLLADDLNIGSSGRASTQNAAFVANVLDSMAGGGQLIGLRGQGLSFRPFTRIDEIEAAAEQRYRDTERQLQVDLEETQKRVAELRGAATTTDGQIIALTAEQRDAIAEFNRRIVEVRQQLRDVRAALRQEIDAVVTRLRLINILAIPAVVILVGVLVAVWRRIRLSRYLRRRGAMV